MGELSRARRGMILPQLIKPASAVQILSGYQAIGGNGELLSGSMADRGAVTGRVGAGGSYTIPEGYHNGAGKVSSSVETVSCTLAASPSAGAYAGDTVTVTYSSGSGVSKVTLTFGSNTSSYGPSKTVNVLKGGFLYYGHDWGTVRVSGVTPLATVRSSHDSAVLFD